MEHKHPPLWKQALGAVIGASLAMVLYSGYQVVSPHVTAYLTIPQAWIQSRTDAVVRVNDNDEEQQRMERRERRAREIAVEFSQRKATAPHEHPAVIHNPPADVAGAKALPKPQSKHSLLASAQPTRPHSPTWSEPTMERLDPLPPPPAHAAAAVTHTPALADSGAQLWLIALVAFTAAGFMVRRGWWRRA